MIKRSRYAKLSITVSPAVLAEIERREEGNVSAVFNRSLERYFALLSRSLARWREQLSDDECALIIDATNGTMFADTFSLGYLAAEVADAISMDGLADKWGVDGPALVEKLGASGIMGQTALIDASERWWGRVAAGEQPGFGELLAAGPALTRYPHGVAADDD